MQKLYKHQPSNKMSNYTYLGKFIQRPGDLAPKGVKSTYQTEKLSFNETFERLWKLKK
jgi:hypothetical protein